MSTAPGEIDPATALRREELAGRLYRTLADYLERSAFHLELHSRQEVNALADALASRLVTTADAYSMPKAKPSERVAAPDEVGADEEDTKVADTSSVVEATPNLIARLLQGAGRKVAERVPWRISTRDLSRHTTKVLAKLHKDQRAAVITYRGLPSFLVLPIDRNDFLTFLLSHSPELEEDDEEAARAELAEGKGAHFS